MGIMFLHPKKYRCSECGGIGKEYVRSAKPERPGTYEGIECTSCSHYSEHYVPTLLELEMGTGQAWYDDPNKPTPF